MRGSAADRRLSVEVREMADASGADLFGIADLASFTEVIRERGWVLPDGMTRAVSIGISLPRRIIQRLADRFDADLAYEYRLVYDETNARLDRIASHLTCLLESSGAPALRIPASRTVDSIRRYGAFSHKMAAHLAGLGWIGRSCLLVTPSAGPGVRWATVLTSAPLEATGTPMPAGCGDCTACVDMCPSTAFSGRSFRLEEERDSRFDTERCHQYTLGMEEILGCPVLCGICVNACPHGRSTNIT